MNIRKSSKKDVLENDLSSLTWWGGAKLLLERSEHLEGKGLAFLPNINQLSNLILQCRSKV
jgi:hypothetical protein